MKDSLFHRFLKDYSAIYGHQVKAVLFADTQGIIVWKNKQLKEYLSSIQSETTEHSYEQQLATIVKEHHQQLFQAWEKAKEIRLTFKFGTAQFQMQVSAMRLSDDNLAGFHVELSEVDEEQNTSSIAQLPINNPNPVLHLTSSGSLLFANPSAQLTLINKERNIKKEVWEVISFALQTNKEEHFQTEINIVLGKKIYRSSLVRNGDTIFVYCNDVTEYSQLERENSENLGLLEAIVNSARNSVILLNNEKKVTYFNQKARIELRRYFGNQLTIGDYLPEFSEKGFNKTIDESLDVVFKSGKQIIFDYENTLDSERQWFNFTIYPVFDVKGIISGICLNILNNTKAKLAEEEIHRTKTFYETILNNIPSDIAVFDWSHRYLYLNPMAIKDPEIRKWMIGKTDYDYFRKKGLDFSIADKRRAMFQNAIDSGLSQDILDHHVKPDGSDHYVFRRFYPLSEEQGQQLVIGYGVDVTNIKVAEQKTLLSEQKFKSLFENNPMLLFIVDENFNVQSANHTAILHFSIQDKQIPGLSFIELVSPSFYDEFKEKFSQAFQLELNQNQSCYCKLTVNHHEFTVEFIATPVISESGEKQLLLAGADHTERIQNEERLRKSEEFNRNLVRDIPIPFAIINWDKAEYINSACRQLIGIKEDEEFDGQNLFDYLFEEDIPLVLNKLRKRYSGQNIDSTLVRLKTRDGLIKHVEIHGGLMNLDNRWLNFITFVDRTDEVIQSKARRNAELRTNQIIETALDAVITTNVRGEIQDWNPKAEQIFGWTESEIKGQRIIDTIIPFQLKNEFFVFAFDEQAGGHLPQLNQSIEMTGKDKNDRVFPIEIFITQLNVEGEVVYSAFIRDISESKAAQEALKESEYKLSMLVGTLPVVPYTMRSLLNYDFTYLNERVEGLLGFSMDKIHSTPNFWLSHVMLDDLPVIKDAHKELLESGETSITYRLRSASGQLIWIRDTMRRVLNEKQGERFMITGVFQDITGEKEEEERRRLIESTLFEISKEELSTRQSLEEFYETVFIRLRYNLGITGMSIWEKDSKGDFYKCENSFQSDKQKQRKDLKTKIQAESLSKLIGQSAFFSSNRSNGNEVEQQSALNKLFNKGNEKSLLLGVIKSSVSEGNLILLENDNPGFKWEYEHQNLIGFISELVSVNMEYFQRIETDGKLREAYQLAKIGAWEIEKDSNKIFWSEAMFEFYGMNAQTDSALPFEEVLPFIHPDDSEATSKAYYSLINESIPYKINCRHILGNGQIRYFEKSAMVRRSPNNRLLFMGVTVDITEKRIAELEQYRRRWRNSMQNAVGSAISPVSSKEELIEVFGNTLINSSSFKEICSFEIPTNKQESDWENVNCFFENGHRKNDSSASHIDQIKQMAKGLHANKGTLHLQFGENDYLMSAVQFPNDNKSYLLFTLASESEIPVGEKLNLINELVQVLQERAERIYAEQQLKELNTELLDTNLQMRQYSFIVSHNLRAPVANILGCLNLYNDQEHHDVRNKRLMDGIKVSAQTVDNILQDLSKILNIKENISKQFEYIPFDKTLELVLDSLHKDMHEVDYEMNVDFSGLAGMRAFRPYLVSIFQNMLSNSFKYRNPSHKLQISIRSFENNGKVVLQFSDNGRGIDLKKYGNTIFKLYSRFHKDIPGSGIGLNMVQEQARAMGGNTQIDSEEGVGTTFTFTFVGKE